MPMPITMNLIRQNGVPPLLLQQYRLPPVSSNNGFSFQFKQVQQGRGNMFRSTMISNIINSKSGCGSCGK